MVPLKRVIAPAMCSSNVAVASSRSRRSWSIRILRARTDAKPGGFGAGLVGPFDRAARPTIAAPRLSYRVQENTTAAGKGSRGFGTRESECSTPPADLVEGFAPDSALQEGVSSEPVSEAKSLLASR